MIRAVTDAEYDRYRIPNLERALVVLETLADHPDGLAMMELAEKLDVPKTGMYRIITTMLYHGYIVRDDNTRKISLSRKLMVLSNTTICQYNIIEESLQYMRQLRDETLETVQLNTVVENQGVVLETVPSIHEVRIVVDPGARFGLHCSAPGKAMLASMPDDEREKILSEMDFPRHSNTTITDIGEFIKELGRVHQKGYGTDIAEGIVPGLHCVSCPVFDHNGFPVAALTVVAPANRLPRSKFDEVAGQVKRNAMMISQRIGYQLPESVQQEEGIGK